MIALIPFSFRSHLAATLTVLVFGAGLLRSETPVYLENLLEEIGPMA